MHLCVDIIDGLLLQEIKKSSQSSLIEKPNEALKLIDNEVKIG